MARITQMQQLMDTAGEVMQCTQKGLSTVFDWYSTVPFCTVTYFCFPHLTCWIGLTWVPNEVKWFDKLSHHYLWRAREKVLEILNGCINTSPRLSPLIPSTKPLRLTHTLKRAQPSLTYFSSNIQKQIRHLNLIKAPSTCRSKKTPCNTLHVDIMSKLCLHGNTQVH